MEAPHSVDTERSALGSLLLDPPLMAEAENIMRPEDFYREQHATVYRALLQLWRAGKPVDFTLLCQKLEDMGDLERIGGAGYITSIIKGTATPAHFSHYALKVVELANRRRVISAAGELNRMAREDHAASEVVEQGHALLAAVAERTKASKPLVPFAEALEGYWAALAREMSGEEPRMPFGFRDLDRLVGGLKPGDLCYIGGRPSMGKTTICLQTAWNLARLGVGPTAVFSVESSEEELAGRLLGYATNVFSDAIRKGKVPQDVLGWLAKVAPEFKVPILLKEEYELSPAGIDAALAKLVHTQEPKLVIVDHLHRMEAGRRFEGRRQEVTYISRRLKALAQKYHVPLIAICTLSRKVEARRPPRPMLGDLKETGDLEHDCDLALLMYWEGHYEEESPRGFLTEVNVAKHRDGPIGTVCLRRGGQGQLSDLMVSKG